MWVYDAAVHAWRDQKWASDLLKLNFQLVDYEQGGCGFWELKLGLLQEQQMPLIAKSSLQIPPPTILYVFRRNSKHILLPAIRSSLGQSMWYLVIMNLLMNKTVLNFRHRD